MGSSDTSEPPARNQAFGLVAGGRLMFSDHRSPDAANAIRGYPPESLIASGLIGEEITFSIAGQSIPTIFLRRLHRAIRIGGIW